MADLSDLERLRLENIKRNAAFLEQLGLLEPKLSNQNITKNEHLNELKKLKNESSKKRRKVASSHSNYDATTSDNITSTRRSPRLSATNSVVVNEVDDYATVIVENIGGDEIINYEQMPISSEELDDFEFQVYVVIRAWRLKRSRELDIEPYKICQNRTIAELIRR